MSKYDFSDFDAPVAQESTKKQDLNFEDFQQKAPISKLESLLRGAKQGATLGFGDEITGAGESALGSLGLVPDKTYEQARDEARQADRLAQLENPLTYGGGQLAGGVATTLLPGGALLKAGQGAMGAAKIGALTGAIAGAGDSEAGLSDAQLYKDALTGGAVGGVAGAALHGLGSLAKGSIGDDATKAYQAAKSGNRIIGEEAAGNINKKMLDTSGNIVDKVVENTKRAGKELGDIRTNAVLDNVRATQEGLEGLANDLQKSDTNGILNGIVSKLKNASANADNMNGNHVEDLLSLVKADLKGSNLSMATQKDIEQKLTDIIFKNNPKFAESVAPASAKFAEESAGRKILKNVSDGTHSDDVIGRENVINQLTQKAKLSAKDAAGDASNQINSIDKFTKQNDMVSALKDQADNFRINKNAAEATFNPLQVAGDLFKGKPPKLSGYASQAADVVGNKVNQFSSNTAVQKASAIASKLGDSQLGQKIQGILNLEPTARDRALFTLSQQPWFRNLTKDNEE